MCFLILPAVVNQIIRLPAGEPNISNCSVVVSVLPLPSPIPQSIYLQVTSAVRAKVCFWPYWLCNDQFPVPVFPAPFLVAQQGFVLCCILFGQAKRGHSGYGRPVGPLSSSFNNECEYGLDGAPHNEMLLKQTKGGNLSMVSFPYSLSIS